MLRAGTGKDIVSNGRFGEFSLIHLLELIARHRMCAVMDTQHAANTHRGLWVIAGDHFDADPGLLAGTDRRYRFRARRIHHSGDAEENESLIQTVMGQYIGIGTRGFPGGSYHPQAFFGIAGDFGLPVRLGKGFRAVRGLLQLAEFKQYIRCPGHQHALVVTDAIMRRHIFVLRIERDFTAQFALNGW